jgi:hypothetical protein
MNDREKSVNVIGNVLEVGRPVVADINRFFPIPTAKLRDVCNRDVIKSPKRILIERFDTLLQPYFNAVSEKVILPKQVLLLNLSK